VVVAGVVVVGVALRVGAGCAVPEVLGGRRAVMRVRAKLYAFDDTLAMMSHNFAQRGWRMEMMSDHAADLPARVARWIAGGETMGSSSRASSGND